MFKSFAAAAACASIVVLAGCSVTKIDTDHMSSADLIKSPQYMGIRPTVPKNVQVIGPIDVTFCQKKIPEGPATADQMMTLLRIAAAQKGATAMAEVSYHLNGPQTDTCFSTATAHGIGYVHT